MSPTTALDGLQSRTTPAEEEPKTQSLEIMPLLYSHNTRKHNVNWPSLCPLAYRNFPTGSTASSCGQDACCFASRSRCDLTRPHGSDATTGASHILGARRRSSSRRGWRRLSRRSEPQRDTSQRRGKARASPTEKLVRKSLWTLAC